VSTQPVSKPDLTFKDAVTILHPDDRVKATVYAINTLLIQRVTSLMRWRTSGFLRVLFIASAVRVRTSALVRARYMASILRGRTSGLDQVRFIPSILSTPPRLRS
jgi:hypothetical protein